MNNKTSKTSAKPAVNQKQQLKLCHISDVHLGYRRYSRLTKEGFNQREADVSAAFREAVTRIIALKPNVTIIAGDLFHSVRPSNAIVAFAFRELRRLVQGTGSPVVMIAGNHESPRRVDSGCVLRLFSEIEGVHVADLAMEAFKFPESSLAVTCLPHAALERLSEIKVRADDNFAHNVLCLHGQMPGQTMSDFGGVDVSPNSIATHEWDYIALGHIHVRTAIGTNAAYSGAIEHTSTNIWSEATAKKGFLEVVLPESKQIFHALTSPREVVQLKPVDAFALSPEEVTAQIFSRCDELSGGLEGKIVRLELENITREVFRALDHKEIRKLRARALHFSIEMRPLVQQTAVSGVRRGMRGKLQDDLRQFREQWDSELAMADEIEQQIDKYLQALEAQNEAA